ncbi:MAG: DUF6089 family protein [Cytophagales bacterium]|nr:DUF6089 family protein [Cytophagales bacterium]
MSAIFRVLLLIFISTYIYAQQLEVGIGGGPTNSRTDISPMHPLNTRLGLWMFVRYNFDPVWVARLDYKYLLLTAKDEYSNTPVSNLRNQRFSTLLLEISANVEYNFLNYRSRDFKIKWCPYLSAGLGYYRYESRNEGDDGRHNVSVPVGGGVKYMLSKSLNLGLLYTASKTFADNMDNVNADSPTYIPQKLRGADLATNDWYHFVGLSISYTFYMLTCPDIYYEY